MNKEIQLYSLRDKNNSPLATIEVRNNIVRQIKGHDNNEVTKKVHKHVYQFILSKGFQIAADHKNIGLERE